MIIYDLFHVSDYAPFTGADYVGLGVHSAKSCGFNSHFSKLHGIIAGPGVEFWAKPSPQTSANTPDGFEQTLSIPSVSFVFLHDRVLVS